MLDRLGSRLKSVVMRRCPISYARYHYKRKLGKRLRYRRPTDLNEKLFWLERYWQHPLVVKCSDKYAVREYVEGCGCGQLLNKLYGVYDRPDEIDFTALPEQFVLKCTHGSRYNVFCVDRDTFDEAAARKRLGEWLKKTYGVSTCEWHYAQITPRIVAENYLDAGQDGLREVQFFCFNGSPSFILARNDLGAENRGEVAVSYDLDWQRLFLRKGEEAFEQGLQKPRNLATMLEAAQRLAQPFPHVRVDFYDLEDSPVFGEMTFSTRGNMLRTYKPEVVVELGKQLSLPNKWRG